MRPFAPSEFCFHAHFNVAGLWHPVRESSSDESVEELENTSEDESQNFLFELLSCSLELELQASIII